ncbi:hypothetical protein [Olsenella sp. HMSC062G07]|uniref:hypothetical protein n=1 Tax=Olsenella sp. HMSC062G07 TaxID=1739330 RepID=UPI00143876D5|nr:hypothetical protein [Olsenella sp. HMSC062G07]
MPLVATRDVTASIDGRDYEVRKGQRVEGPPQLIEALKEIDAVKAARAKKESTDD